MTLSFNTVVFLLEVQVMVPPLARLEALPLALAYVFLSAAGTAHPEMVTVLFQSRHLGADKALRSGSGNRRSPDYDQ